MKQQSKRLDVGAAAGSAEGRRKQEAVSTAAFAACSLLSCSIVLGFFLSIFCDMIVHLSDPNRCFSRFDSLALEVLLKKKKGGKLLYSLRFVFGI